jgi:hypothetical protein
MSKETKTIYIKIASDGMYKYGYQLSKHIVRWLSAGFSSREGVERAAKSQFPDYNLDFKFYEEE